jgi:hypothetical protein
MRHNVDCDHCGKFIRVMEMELSTCVTSWPRVQGSLPENERNRLLWIFYLLTVSKKKEENWFRL